MNNSIKTMKQNLSSAFQNYYLVKKNDGKKRYGWLQELAGDIAADKEGSSESHYKQLITREKQRLSARRISSALGKTRGQGVVQVKTKNENGDYKTLTSKEEIERVCLHENLLKYTQTNDTPLMNTEHGWQLGFTGISDMADSILNGTFPSPVLFRGE